MRIGNMMGLVNQGRDQEDYLGGEYQREIAKENYLVPK
jgi:hypothetical protein